MSYFQRVLVYETLGATLLTPEDTEWRQVKVMKMIDTLFATLNSILYRG
jgi:hypothetical protein